jgi:hypothetical protein
MKHLFKTNKTISLAKKLKQRSKSKQNKIKKKARKLAEHLTRISEGMST